MIHKRLISVGSLALLAILIAAYIESSEAGQGCPFDNESCQDYCAQQGCSMGYCGHFAWIQCICRRCGDEWNWYDKVRYKPDEKVNQTELDSLKLNSSAPIILTNSTSSAPAKQLVEPSTATNTNNNNNKPANSQAATTTSNQKQAATLTTLLIPDLSESNGKLDLNDIPDENSDKFLDFLANNHERLVQATNSEQLQPSTTEQPPEDSESGAEPTEETVEIQISSNNSTSTPNNNSPRADALLTQSDSLEAASNDDQDHNHQPLTRLLKIAVANIK